MWFLLQPYETPVKSLVGLQLPFPEAALGEGRVELSGSGPGGKAQVCQWQRQGHSPGKGLQPSWRDTPHIQGVIMNAKFPLGLSVPIVAFHSDPLGPLRFHWQGPRQDHPAGVPVGGC